MSHLTTKPLTTSIGAQVDGVDLTAPLNEDVQESIRQALATHSVLVFKNQHLNDKQQEEVARIFGPIVPAPSRKLFGLTEAVRVIERQIFNLADEGTIPYAPRRDEFQGWHVDDTFCAQIPSAAVLRPLALAPAGGDTSWASMGAVFASFSTAMQSWLETLNGIHAAPPSFRATVGFYNLPKHAQQQFDKEQAARAHPIVVQHPVTGKKILFVNPTYTVEIEGFNRRESANLLRFLFSESVRPDVVYRHYWEFGDVVIWDELATLHCGPENFAPERQLIRIYGGLTTPTAACSKMAPSPTAVSA